jgi:hypothetical protein
MRKEKLTEIGGFVAETPVEREVTWTRATDGTQFTFSVFIRQLPFAEFEEFDTDNVSNLGKLFAFLAKVIWLESDDGLVPLGLDAKRLNQDLAMALWEAARSVNGLGEGKR